MILPMFKLLRQRTNPGNEGHLPHTPNDRLEPLLLVRVVALCEASAKRRGLHSETRGQSEWATCEQQRYLFSSAKGLCVQCHSDYSCQPKAVYNNTRTHTFHTTLTPTHSITPIAHCPQLTCASSSLKWRNESSMSSSFSPSSTIGTILIRLNTSSSLLSSAKQKIMKSSSTHHRR